jgi:acetyltransferase
MKSLKRMLDPKQIALVGATERRGTIGRALFKNLIRSGRQRIFPVNPRRKTLFGSPCYPSADALPSGIDLAVIAVRAALVPEALERCGRAGAAGALIISAGFTPNGVELEELRRIADGYGMRIIGPASFGIIRPPTGLHASFLSARPQPGNIAFIAQSGQLGSAMLKWGPEAHVGFSIFVSLGSMIDVDFGDLLDFLGDDYGTRSVLLNMERVVDARKFLSAARGFSRSKPIIVIKPGRHASPEGTGAGSDGAEGAGDLVYDAAFKRVGVVRVAEAKDLFDAALVLDSPYLPAGPRLGVVGNADTIAAMATDALIELDGRVAELSPATAAELLRILPHGSTGKNPVDLGDDADIDRYVKGMDACLEDPGVDGLLVICAALAKAVPGGLATAVASAAKKKRKPLIVAWMGGSEMRRGMRLLRDNKVPVYTTPEEAVRAYMDMFRYKRSLDLLYETPAELPTGRVPIRRLKVIAQKAVKEGRPELTPDECADFLRGYGFPPTATERAGMGRPVGPVRWDLYLTMTRDREFGSVIRFGLGGITRHIWNDCGVGLPPLNQTLARRLIEESLARTVLSTSHLARLEEMLVEFSNMVVDFPEITAIFIDPLVVRDEGIYASDTRIILAPARADRGGPYPHLVITPYPTRYGSQWRLPDGTEVVLRPIRPEDEPLQHDLFYTLSEETVRERFFSPMKEMTHEMLARFCNIDYDREIAIVAEVRDREKKRIAGISRLIMESGARAEFAVLVHDDYQGMGLGRKLVDVLIGIAWKKGLDEVYGITLTENERLQKLVKSMGFTASLQPDGITKVTLKLARP